MNQVKKSFNLILSLLMMMMILITSGCGDDKNIVTHKDSTAKEVKQQGEIKYKIYLITMNQGSNYWKQIDTGCQQAVKENEGIDYHWIAPAQTNIPEQIQCVERAISEGADAIIISVASKTEIDDVLKKANSAGIKVIYVDSVSKVEGIAALITDNEKAGQLAGQTLLKALNERGITSGTIGISASNVTQNGINRDKGFRSAFNDTNFVVAPTFDMQSKLENLKRFVLETPEYVGYFAATEQMTAAISEQVKAKNTRQLIVGFDTSDYTLTMIKEGIIYATMQQKPQKMGHDAVEIAIKSIEGTFKEKNVTRDLGVEVITKDKI